MTGAIGKSVQRTDITDKVRGRSRFPQDCSREGQLHAKAVWAAHPRARVLHIDTSRAENVPGVVRVLTAADVPVNEYGIMTFDQPVLIAVGSETHWTGDRLALVVAETEAAAARARDLVAVEYEVLAPLADPRAAMGSADLVHPGKESNMIQHLLLRRGHIEDAFARSDLVLEATYHTQCVEHAYLQPEACLGYVDEEGRIALVVATQWPHDDIRQLAHLLGLPEEQLRIIVPAVGGAFGGREDMSLQPLVALAVHVLHRPVKMVWSREESIRGHGKRHPFHIRLKTGCTADGELQAIEAECVSDAGAYESTSVTILADALSFISGPYRYPNCSIDGYTVYTNNAPGMAMRGFGAAQAAFAYEQQMDRMARALGLDPVAFRLGNILEDHAVRLTGNEMPPGTGARACLAAAAKAAGWQEGDGSWTPPQIGQPLQPERRRGIGVACTYKNVGYSFGFDDQSTARVRLELDSTGQIARATVHLAAVEVGQGVTTTLTQIAAEALDLPVERVSFAKVDTATSPDAGSCSASRHTYMSGNAVYLACQKALSQRQQALRDESGEEEIEASYTYRGQSRRPTTDWDPVTGECNPHFSYAYGAQVALIEVDIETGEIEVLKVWSANNAGKVIHPAAVCGQSAGGLAMGLGYALMEDVVHESGRLRTRRLSEYPVPTAVDMPREFVDIQIEVPDPSGPFGATGIGEVPLLSTAPAVLNALADATGAYLDTIPATPERVWHVLATARHSSPPGSSAAAPD
jgi:CO/xanthine dehydrogenase Mo-binding subunit